MTITKSLKLFIVTVAAVGLLLPPLAAALLGFSRADGGLSLAPLMELLDDKAVVRPIVNTLWLTVASIVGGFALVVPTLVWLHLKSPKLLPLMEGISMLPYIIPPIALVSGVSLALRPLAPGFFANIVSLIPFYILITLPFTYRAVDSGLRAMDLGTLMRASESLGAGNIRTLLVGAILAATMVTGEFVLSSLLLHKTFPTMLVELGQSKVRLAAALSFLAMMFTWLLMAVLMGGSRGKRKSATTTLAM